MPFLPPDQQCQSTSSLFFHGKLVLSVAVSTTDRKASQLVAFLLAEDRPMFKGLKSDSTACSHVCLGCPTGCLQPDDDFRIATEGKLNGSVKEPNIFHNSETEKSARKVYEQLFENFSARLRYFALEVTPACSFHRSAYYCYSKILKKKTYQRVLLCFIHTASTGRQVHLKREQTELAIRHGANCGVTRVKEPNIFSASVDQTRRALKPAQSG